MPEYAIQDRRSCRPESAESRMLLGGVTGLRLEEMMALEWTDIDFIIRQITVARSEWKGQVTAPKGGETRLLIEEMNRDSASGRRPRASYASSARRSLPGSGGRLRQCAVRASQCFAF